jgi:hypothetical protein
VKGPALSEWRALSLRQPWFWMVLRPGGKDIENRTRNLGLPRAPFLLHASGSMTWQYHDEAWNFVDARFGELKWRGERPRFEQYRRMGYCGVTRAVGLLKPDGSVVLASADPKATTIAVSQEHRIVSVAPDGERPRTWDLRWHMGAVGYLLEGTRALPFVPGPGSRGFFRVPAETVRALGLPPDPEEYEPPAFEGPKETT